MNLLDLIFPKKCINCSRLGDFVCPDCFAKISYVASFACPVCNRPSINGLTHPSCQTPHALDGVISVVVYNKVVKKLIYKFKYEPHLRALGPIIGELMAEGLSQNESFYGYMGRHDPVIVPIPLSARRYRKRGYNHAELLGSYVAQYFSLKINPKILIRVRDTKPQYKLRRQERLDNIRSAFDIIREKTPIPESIILIDDIATSFTTLNEAAKVLKRAGAKHVLGVAFAREAV